MDVADELVPRLRGVSHAVAVWIAAAAAIVLIVIAADGAPRVTAAIYGAGLTALFAGSALYHRWRWNPRWRPLLRRVDHSTIFIFIAASYTPISVIVLEGTFRTVVLIVVWAGAALGIALSIAWIDAPRWLTAATYLGLGWVAVATAPQLAERLHPAPLTLIAVGGVLYTVGAVVYATRRPDPWPRTFGFHEIFHAFVIAAAVVHFVAISGWVVT